MEQLRTHRVQALATDASRRVEPNCVASPLVSVRIRSFDPWTCWARRESQSSPATTGRHDEVAVDTLSDLDRVP